MKIIESLLIIGLSLLRLFVIYKVIVGLFLNFKNPIDFPLSDIYWYVIFIILDSYIIKVFESE
jgi:hypothetical protein